MSEKGPIRRVVNLENLDSKFEQLAEKRIVFLAGPILPGVAEVFTAEVLTAGFEKDKSKPLWIIINSPGGEVFSGLAIHDVVRMLVDQGLAVNTVACGVVASMAVPILQAGTKRFALPNAHILIHQISLHGLNAKEINQLSDDLKDSMKLNSRLIKIVTERCGISEERLTEDSKKKDLLFDAEEAREYGEHGLIDEILFSIPI